MMLLKNPHEYLGINGSDFTRSYFYFRLIQRNYDTLKKQLKIRGLKFYVRVLKGSDNNAPLKTDPADKMYSILMIDKKPLIEHESLFNNFVFFLR